MKYVLAPLAGFTDAPFRRLCFENGADLAYTEMVSAAGLAHGSSPTRQLLEIMPGEGPVACQLFGAKESDLAYAARFIEENYHQRQPQISDHTSYASFTELNLNAGCPMIKVTREGAGAKLVEDPTKIYRLLKAMVENTELSVTLKTRLGPHPKDTKIFEILDAAEQAGAKGLILHARYTSQMHGGPVQLEKLAEVVERSHIPVTGNGSVVDVATAAAITRTKVDAIMIGRAALAHPDIFAHLKSPSVSLLPAASSFARQHLDYVLQFREQLAIRYPSAHIPSVDGYASVKMHTHLFRYFNGRPGAAALRQRLNTVRTLAEINDIISTC